MSFFDVFTLEDKTTNFCRNVAQSPSDRRHSP